jgi:hypothetical protein
MMHTSGPWYTNEFGMQKRSKSICIMAFGPLNEEGGDVFFLAELKAKDNENYVEDAQVMAAAPELLQACKAALEMIGNIPDYVPMDTDDLAAQLITAIAKAEGRDGPD